MNKKLIGLFILLTILPSALLVWLGRTGIAAEEERNRSRLADLCRGRLDIEKGKIKGLFASIEKELLSFRDTKSVDDARVRLRRAVVVRQLFALDAKGKAVFPAETSALSEAERDFLVRTKELGLSPGLFLKRSEEAPGSFSDFGWYSWYLVDGVNFIFWMKAPPKTGLVPGGILGLELNRMAVLKAVLGALPDTNLEETPPFRVVLADLGGKTLYQWEAMVQRRAKSPSPRSVSTRLSLPGA